MHTQHSNIQGVAIMVVFMINAIFWRDKFVSIWILSKH